MQLETPITCLTSRNVPWSFFIEVSNETSKFMELIQSKGLSFSRHSFNIWAKLSPGAKIKLKNALTAPVLGVDIREPKGLFSRKHHPSRPNDVPTKLVITVQLTMNFSHINQAKISKCLASKRLYY